VVSYLVSQNQHDIGLRVALGAQRGDIIGMVMRQRIGLAAWGIGAGLAGALSLTRLMGNMLFGVSARDVMTFSALFVALGMIAMIATYVPARRGHYGGPNRGLTGRVGYFW
jgi:putative ABC transport system permease protein